MAKPIRNNFNAGELSPLVDFRGDIDKYNSGLLTAQNFVPLIEGGAQQMPGSYFSASTKSGSGTSRFVPFTFSTTQAYDLEFGDLYIRFYRNETRIEVMDVPVEVTTTYAEADIPLLKFNQSADVLYVTHPDYETRKLTRLSHTSWTLTVISFRPGPTREFGHKPVATLTPAATTGNAVTFTASVSSFLSGDVGRIIIFGASRAAIVGYTSDTVVTCDILDAFPDTDPIASQSWTILYTPVGSISPSKIKRGEISTITSVSTSAILGNLWAAGDNWTASGSGTNEYYINNGASFYSAVEPDAVLVDNAQITQGTIGSLGISQWAWGDNDALGYSTIYIRLSDGADPDSKAAGFVQRSDGATSELFRSDDVGKFIYSNSGFLQITIFTSATSVNAEVMADLETTDSDALWRLEEPMWNATNGYPSCSAFFEQRLCFAGAPGFPQTINCSVSGDYENFFRDPDLDDSAIEYTIVSDQVEAVRWLLAADFFMIGTVGGLWKMGAITSTEPFSQNNVTAKKQAGLGVKNISPIQTTDSVMWVDLSGLRLKKLVFDLKTDSYVVSDMTRLASHIAKGASSSESGFTQLAFQKSPFPIIWGVRADGELAGMAYDAEENMYAWFRVVTDGEFESISITSNEDSEDTVGVIVKRTVSGATQRYAEYFQPFELFSQIKDSFFVDSGVTYDGGDAVTITGITNANPAVVTATNTFSGGELVRISDVEGMTEANTGYTKAWTVANPTGTTFELSGITSAGWGTYTSGGEALVVQKDFSSGLSHLEGESIAVLLDGGVHPNVTVSSGTVALSQYGNKISVGRPRTAVLEPTRPYIETSGGLSIAKKQKISSIIPSFYETSQGKVGPDTDNLRTIPFGAGAPALFTGELDRLGVGGNWGDSAPLVIVQDKPLPMTVRGIIYELKV